MLMDDPQVTRVRILLCFLHSDSKDLYVRGIARILNELPKKISRYLMTMEEDGLVDRTDPRHPVLTAEGLEKAHYYEERVSLLTNHFMYEGVNIEDAKEDAFAGAIYMSESTIDAIRRTREQYQLKYELRGIPNFDGRQLCYRMNDGMYEIPFLLCREHIGEGNILSMGNSGFDHPCTLVIKNGTGKILLRTVNVSKESMSNGHMMMGKVTSFSYLANGEWNSAEITGDVISFPINSMQFFNIGNDAGQMLHGNLTVKIAVSVGTRNMPESKAVFIVIF